MRCPSCGKAEMETEAIYLCPACGDDYTGGLAAKVIDAHTAALHTALAAAERRAEEAERERSRLSLLVHDYGKEANALASRVSALEGAAREWDEADEDVGPLDSPYSPQGIRLRVAKEALRAALSAPAPEDRRDD